MIVWPFFKYTRQFDLFFNIHARDSRAPAPTASTCWESVSTVSNHPLCTWSALDLLCTVHPNNAFALHGIFIALAAIIHSALDLHSALNLHFLHRTLQCICTILHCHQSSTLKLDLHCTVSIVLNSVQCTLLAIVQSALQSICTQHCICTILHCQHFQM